MTFLNQHRVSIVPVLKIKLVCNEILAVVDSLHLAISLTIEKLLPILVLFTY